MKISTLIAALAAMSTVASHTVFTTLFVNDFDQCDGTCVRMPMTPSNATFPINNLSSNDMACGYDGTASVARVCPVNQSSKLSVLFRETPDGSRPGSIDPAHKGPCAVYMKSVTDPVKDAAIGGGWFKIWDEGYDSSTSQWCTEKLIQNNGFLSVTIPSDLAGGYYLVRPELLALHQADKTPPNPQFYVGCAQVFLNSTASSLPQDTVSIPGYVNISDPSILFNIYTPKWPYPMVGPEPYASGSSSSTQLKAVLSQNEGLLPSNVVLTNANWWGLELDTYSTVDGCWNASKSCWDQCTTCYGTAPPTGSANCKIWEAKCTAIQSACDVSDFNGPPNQSENLNPQPKTTYTSIPAAPTESGGIYSGSVSVPAASDPPKISYSPLVVSDTTNMTLTPASIPDSCDLTATSCHADAAAKTSASEIISSSSRFKVTPFMVAPSAVSPSAPSSTNPSSSLKVSKDGQCGNATGQGCINSTFGDCCSDRGWCGLAKAYCGTSCQSDFGGCSIYVGGKHKRQYVGHRHF